MGTVSKQVPGCCCGGGAPPPCTVTVSVKNCRCQPYVGATVTMTQGATAIGTCTTGADGTCQVGFPASGSYTFAAAGGGYSQQRTVTVACTGAVVTLYLAPNQVTVTDKYGSTVLNRLAGFICPAYVGCREFTAAVTGLSAPGSSFCGTGPPTSGTWALRYELHPDLASPNSVLVVAYDFCVTASGGNMPVASSCASLASNTANRVSKSVASLACNPLNAAFSVNARGTSDPNPSPYDPGDTFTVTE